MSLHMHYQRAITTVTKENIDSQYTYVILHCFKTFFKISNK